MKYNITARRNKLRKLMVVVNSFLVMLALVALMCMTGCFSTQVIAPGETMTAIQSRLGEPVYAKSSLDGSVAWYYCTQYDGGVRMRTINMVGGTVQSINVRNITTSDSCEDAVINESGAGL